MSTNTCARSAGAYLFRCVLDQDLYWPLAQMQREVDSIAEGVLPAAPRPRIPHPPARRHP